MIMALDKSFKMKRFPLAVSLLLLGLHVGCSHGACKSEGGEPVLQPVFVQPSSNSLELLPSDDATLICEVQRNVNPDNPPMYGLTIWWCNSTYPRCHEDRQATSSLDGNLYLNVTRSKAGNASSLRSVFHLMDLQPSQSDTFYCVAYSEDPSSSMCPGSVAVDVLIKERSDPKITTHTLAKDVLVGNAFNLTCAADGYPSPSFEWTKDGKAINGGERGIFSRDAAIKKDEGVYRCRAVNKFTSSSPSSKIEVKVRPQDKGLTPVALGLIIAAGCILAILLIGVIFRLWKLRSNVTCCTINRTNVSGDNNKVVHAKTVHVYQDSGTRRPSRRDSSHERRTFLHMHDVFIHNHSSDNQLAVMIRSKLKDRESHLKVGLWSEAESPERSSSRNKLLRLRLLNCSRIVIIVTDSYLKYNYHALLSALAKSRVKPESIRSKIIIVRMLEENKIPKDIMRDVMANLEYNVDTDSCYFWPKFMKVAMPDQKEILYWV